MKKLQAIIHNCLLLFLLAIVSIFVSNCSSKPGLNANDYNVEVYRPGYASGFLINKAAGDGKSVVITSINPWQGATNESRSLFIRRCGERIPEGFEGEVVSENVSRIVCMSSTHIAMLEAIDQADKIVGVSGIDYISSPSVQNRKEKIADVGYEGNVNYELLVSLKPDIVLLYGVNGVSSMEKKLKELKIPFMYVGDYLEQSPLGKAEWMVALAELTNVRENGINRFNPIAKSYNETVRMASSIANSYNRVKVLLNTPYGDSWFIPSQRNYMSQLIRDAGGEILGSMPGNESLTIDTEMAYKYASEADFWLNVGAANSSISALQKNLPKFGDTDVVKNHKVYDNTLRLTNAGGNDFYESGVVNPHLILRDLMNIFQSESDDSATAGDKRKLEYYKQLK